jgi:IMP dehydrogenase
VRTPPLGPLREILLGPAETADGTTNVFGALRSALALTGHANLKEFQRAEVVVGPGGLESAGVAAAHSG